LLAEEAAPPDPPLDEAAPPPEPLLLELAPLPLPGELGAAPELEDDEPLLLAPLLPPGDLMTVSRRSSQPASARPPRSTITNALFFMDIAPCGGLRLPGGKTCAGSRPL
jgi:hypothetical protein